MVTSTCIGVWNLVTITLEPLWNHGDSQLGRQAEDCEKINESTNILELTELALARC
jgi:hypothetical protein